MEIVKEKGPRLVLPPEVAHPSAAPEPVIDLALLKDIGGFVDDPEAWFHTPNGEFEWRMPIEMLGTPDEARLRNRIEAAKLGMFS